MKWSRALVAPVSLTLLIATGAMAQPPAVPYQDEVDIGDPASEATHNLLGWGPIEPETHTPGSTTSYGGIGGETPPGQCRTMWSPDEPGSQADPPLQEWAEVDLDFGAAGGVKTLWFRYLDGVSVAGNPPVSTDNHTVHIGTDLITTVITGDPGEVWEWSQSDVSAYSGTQTLHFTAISPAGSLWDPYGQVAIDRVILIREGIDAQVDLAIENSDPINCAGAKAVTCHYVQGDTEIRGYSVRVQCSPELSFLDSDIEVNTLGLPAEGAYVLHIFRAPGVAGDASNDWTIDFVLLGDLLPGEGIPTDIDLFSINFHGVATGTGVVSFASASMASLAGPFITVDPGPPVNVEVDCLAPGKVTAITAELGTTNNTIDLAWGSPGGDLTHFEIYRALWHDGTVGVSAYPEYDDVQPAPPRPADREAALASPDWELVDTVPGGVMSYTDGGGGGGGGALTRGVYYYEVFAGDALENYGPRADTNARSTSYLLGDLDGDGKILINPEIHALSLCYGFSEQDPPPDPDYYNNECDIGPLDPFDAFAGWGVPITDNEIEFGDLMIFSVNFNIVLSRDLPAEGTWVALLNWNRIESNTWALELSTACRNFKGLNLSAEIPAGAVLNVAPGALLAEQSAPYFLENVSRNGLDIGLALLGRGARIQGSGEILRVTLAADTDLSQVSIELRGTSNESVPYELQIATSTPDLPLRYELSSNFPNPFNPLTKIRFALPEAQPVRLAIFALDGRRVISLLDEQLPAGHHAVIWDGRNERGETVASGTYFTRLEAGSFHQTCKMTLLK